jgi:hypothetical protein
MSLHVPHGHPHAPHPDYEHHPWRLLPTALAAIVVFAALFIVISFALAKGLGGSAY